jgi:outer membrane protein assembly factor BamB
MKTMKRGFRIAVLLVLTVHPLNAMKIKWTAMTGQWPVETMPTVVDLNGDHQQEILTINRYGQLLYWDTNGNPLGKGQDGCVVQLPEGRWTSPVTVARNGKSHLLLLCSVEGLLVAMNERFQILWQDSLSGQTAWGRAIPAVMQSAAGTQIFIGDLKGAVTSYSLDGHRNWRTVPASGGCQAPLAIMDGADNSTCIAMPSGNTLSLLDASGKALWKKKVDADITTKPLRSLSAPTPQIICGTKSGSLYAFSMTGEALWQNSVGDEINVGITELPRRQQSSLLLFTGLWGNLYAVDASGKRAWTHYFRSKTRSAPVLYDANGDHVQDILVTAFNQHLYAFDQQGHVMDDVRLSGTPSNSPVLVPDKKSGRTDVLITTSTILEYCLRAGQAESQYGAPIQVQHIELESAHRGKDKSCVQVYNPEGGLVRVNLIAKDAQGYQMIKGAVSSRTIFELSLPTERGKGPWTLTGLALNNLGKPLVKKSWQIDSDDQTAAAKNPTPVWRCWAVQPYAGFDETQLCPPVSAAPSVAIDNIYQGEADQGACIVASTSPRTIRSRVILDPLITREGKPFAGTVTMRQVIPTGSFNGELAGDALPEVGDAGVVTIPPNTAIKLWLSIETLNSAPGCYNALLKVIPLQPGVDTLKMPVQMEIQDLAMRRPFSLKLCTWDYVPNNWFQSSAVAALDDMAKHGVNIFPRTSCIPPGVVQADGKLAIDWSVLDVELERLHDRGIILFQLTHPPITFSGSPSDAQKRAKEIEYLHAFRDRLSAKGREYDQYGFYPVDEPGLDFGKMLWVLVDAATLIHEADSRFRLYTDPVPSLCRQDFERILPLMDIWCPNMRLVSGLVSGDPRILKIMQSGRPVWSYECVAQPKSISPLCYNRANAWRGKFFGLSGIGFWTHSTSPFDMWFTSKTLNDEYALVYPGLQPVPSVRWEAVRDGLEDVTAITILQEQIEKHKQNETASALVNEAKQIIRRALVDIVELSDGAFIESRDYLAKGDRVIGHTESDLSVYERHRAEIARLTKALAAVP